MVQALQRDRPERPQRGARRGARSRLHRKGRRRPPAAVAGNSAADSGDGPASRRQQVMRSAL